MVGSVAAFGTGCRSSRWNGSGTSVTTDYGAFGVLAIAVLYFLRKDRKQQVLCGCVLFLWEITAPLAFLPIYYYNGKRGINVKYIFYFFYPVHLLIFGLIIKFAF